MTADIVIRAEDLGKTYSIGHRKERQQDQNLRDVFARTLSNFGRGIADMAAVVRLSSAMTSKNSRL